MQIEQKADFFLMMNKLSNIYGKKMNQDILDVYWECLKGYRIFDVGNAFMSCIKEYKHFPKPAQILPFCSKSLRDYYGIENRDRTNFINYNKQENLQIGNDNV